MHSKESQNRFFNKSKCGEKLVVGSKFCNFCGTPTNNADPKKEEKINEEPRVEYNDEPITERQTVYEGNVHKCPNCGEVLNAFTANCPACGHELRGTKATSAVRELAAKLEAIESKREAVKHNALKSLYFGQSLTKTDEQKISLIRSFSIPNTKEDLYEFLILSESNIDIDLYDEDGNQFKKNDARRAVSDAWKAKFEQAYQKAKILFAGDPRLTEIQALYDATHQSIKKAKWKTWKFVGILWGILLVVFAIIITLSLTIASCAKNDEVARLESIETKIETALDEGDYKLALMNAESLDFNGNDAGLEKDWEIKREYWIDKVIDEAAEHGVILEKPATEPNIDSTTKNIYDNSSSEKGTTNLPTDKPNTNVDSFDEESVIKQLKVTEHCRNEYGHYFPVLIIENPTSFNLSLSVDIKFYDKSDKLVGAQSNSVNAFEKGTKTILTFSVDEEFKRMEYEFTVEEEEYYNCVITSLKYENVSAKDKEILSVTNTGALPAEFVQGYALFFKNGKLVETDWTYFTDDDSEIKPGKTITKEMNSYGIEYDSVEFYFTGHAEKD